MNPEEAGEQERRSNITMLQARVDKAETEEGTSSRKSA